MSTGGALTTGEPQPNQVDVLERGDKKKQPGRAAGDDPGVPYWYASEQRKGKLLCSRVLENSVAQSARAAGSSWTFVARRGSSTRGPPRRRAGNVFVKLRARYRRHRIPGTVKLCF